MEVWNKAGLIALSDSEGNLYTLVGEDKTTWSRKGAVMLILPDDTDNPVELAGTWELVGEFRI